MICMREFIKSNYMATDRYDLRGEINPFLKWGIRERMILVRGQVRLTIWSELCGN